MSTLSRILTTEFTPKIPVADAVYGDYVIVNASSGQKELFILGDTADGKVYKVPAGKYMVTWNPQPSPTLGKLIGVLIRDVPTVAILIPKTAVKMAIKKRVYSRES